MSVNIHFRPEDKELARKIYDAWYIYAPSLQVIEDEVVVSFPDSQDFQGLCNESKGRWAGALPRGLGRGVGVMGRS